MDLRNQDCMEALREFDDDQFDLAICDPPYFRGPQRLGYFGGTKTKIGPERNGYAKLGTWEVPPEEYFHEVQRVSRNQIIWGINYYEIENLGPGRIVWDKVNTKSTFSDCELAYCSSIRAVKLFRFMWNGMLQGSEQDGAKQEGDKRKNEKRIHPTQKPVQLYRWLLEQFSEPGHTILDTHLGSGSIGIACHERGRPLTACEIDPEYFRLASERIARHTSQQQLI